MLLYPGKFLPILLHHWLKWEPELGYQVGFPLLLLGHKPSEMISSRPMQPHLYLSWLCEAAQSIQRQDASRASISLGCIWEATFVRSFLLAAPFAEEGLSYNPTAFVNVFSQLCNMRTLFNRKEQLDWAGDAKSLHLRKPLTREALSPPLDPSAKVMFAVVQSC